MISWDNFKPDQSGPKYLAISDALVAAIERGELEPGRRLPSHRMMAHKLDVAVGTVTRAYDEVFKRGLISGEVGRGSYVRHHPAMPLSVVDSSRIPPGSLDLYQNFPVAIPEVENRAWSDALAALTRRNDLSAMARTSWSELSERSQMTGAHWIGRSGLKTEPRQIIDCPGVQSALGAILAATTEPGNLVVAPALSHPAIKLLAHQYGLGIRGVPLDEDGIEAEAFEALCRETSPRLLYVAPTIHSPTTATMPEDRRRAIAEIARRHDVLILEDESAAFLLPEPALPIAAFAPERTFFVGDVWMALSLGLRTTYVRAPESMMPEMLTAVASTSGVTPRMVAEIASMWILSDTADRLIEHRRAELEARNAIAVEILGRRDLHWDRYGHHVWLELPQPWKAELFVVRCEQKGVAVNSADWFSIGHSQLPEAIRICIGNAPGRRELRWALETIDRVIDEPRSGARPAL